MDGLVAFLAARLIEDEAAARDSYYEGQRWITEEESVCRYPGDELVLYADRKRDARHIARHNPARVLREVEAKRRILGWAASPALPDYEKRYVLDALAAVYSDHPDYREE